MGPTDVIPSTDFIPKLLQSVALIGGLPIASLYASEPADTTSLQEVTVEALRGSFTPVKAGTISLNPNSPGSIHTLGEADAFSAARTLPGIHTIGDYGAGLVIDSSDLSSTIYRLGRMPIYFPYHFASIAGTFIPPHIRSARIERTAHSAGFPDRTGALMEFIPNDLPPSDGHRLKGSANVGLIASTVSMKWSPSPRLTVTASGRAAYIDLLYRNLLKMSGQDVNYDMADGNMTITWHPDSLNTLTGNFFINRDNLKLLDSGYAVNTSLHWGNIAGSIDWRRLTRVMRLSAHISCSAYGNTMDMNMDRMRLKAPSGLVTYNADLALDFIRPTAGCIYWSAGVQGSAIRLRPQSVETAGFGNRPPARSPRLRYYTAALYADGRATLGPRFTLQAGVRLDGGGGYGATRLYADPRATLTYHAPAGVDISLHGGIYHQYLNMVGISDIGMSANFWTLPVNGQRPTRAATGSIGIMAPLHADRFTIDAGAYIRRLRNAPEYTGFVLGMLAPDYDYAANISLTDGLAYGAHVNLMRNNGNVTGWIGYAWADDRRHFHGDSHTFTAMTCLHHTVNAAVTWQLDRHWIFNANFSYATGRPYTPVKAIYLIAGSIISEGCERNSGKLPDSHRLDLGATYLFQSECRGRRLRHSVNLSLLNAYGHRNIEMQTAKYDADKGVFYLKQAASIVRFLPSLSYSIEF